jgi:hypothetical protein
MAVTPGPGVRQTDPALPGGTRAAHLGQGLTAPAPAGPPKRRRAGSGGSRPRGHRRFPAPVFGASVAGASVGWCFGGPPKVCQLTQDWWWSWSGEPQRRPPREQEPVLDQPGDTGRVSCTTSDVGRSSTSAWPPSVAPPSARRRSTDHRRTGYPPGPSDRIPRPAGAGRPRVRLHPVGVAFLSDVSGHLEPRCRELPPRRGEPVTAARQAARWPPNVRSAPPEFLEPRPGPGRVRRPAHGDQPEAHTHHPAGREISSHRRVSSSPVAGGWPPRDRGATARWYSAGSGPPAAPPNRPVRSR